MSRFKKKELVCLFYASLDIDVGAISRRTFVCLDRQAVHFTDPHPYGLN